jgi:hypothetical protein
MEEAARREALEEADMCGEMGLGLCARGHGPVPAPGCPARRVSSGTPAATVGCVGIMP